jgi:Zn ribbon nucleic-acid-binding protein
METKSNKCPVCQTEFNTQQTKETAIKYLNISKNNYAKLEEENKNLKTKIEELNQKIQELQLQLRKYEHPDDVKIQELLNQLTHPLIIEAIKSIINKFNQQPNNQVTADNQDDLITNKSEEDINNQNLDEIRSHDINQLQKDNYTESAIVLTPLELELVTRYKNHDIDFRQSIIKVSESEETQENRRGGKKKNTIFQKDHLGNYWIYTREESSYIFPPEKLTINEYNRETVESVFDCQSYNHNQSRNFILIKPGKVTSINEDKWEVIEPGILQF